MRNRLTYVQTGQASVVYWCKQESPLWLWLCQCTYIHFIYGYAFRYGKTIGRERRFLLLIFSSIALLRIRQFTIIIREVRYEVSVPCTGVKYFSQFFSSSLISFSLFFNFMKTYERIKNKKKSMRVGIAHCFLINFMHSAKLHFLSSIS